MVPTVEWKHGIVRLLDQSRLPEHVEFLDCRDYRAVADAIRELKVRGAPAIGVTAALGVALGAQARGCADELAEQRRRPRGPRLELRVELRGHEPRVVGDLDRLPFGGRDVVPRDLDRLADLLENLLIAEQVLEAAERFSPTWPQI